MRPHNAGYRRDRVAAVLLVLAAAPAVTICTAMDRPPQEAVGRMQSGGTYAQRVQEALAIGNQKARPYIAQRAAVKLERARLKLQGKTDAEIDRTVRQPPSAWQGMPTVGSPKILLMLVEFPDRPHTISVDAVKSMIFGHGDDNNYPRESLKQYYQRASYGKLDLQGDVLGWYQCKHDRSWYKPDGAACDNAANYKIIEEAVDYFDSQGQDFSQYDNNKDGYIDYFAIMWTGPRGEWATFWWGYQTALVSGKLVRDGVRFYNFSWQQESDTPNTIIHETGHALGLPDYYDYDDTVGPRGGVGGLDIMDAAWGDHNAFSKWLLDWLEPRVVSAGEQVVALKAAGKYPDALIVMPGASSSNAFSEFFIVQNRQRVENDPANYPADGVLIWHVDARLNAQGTDFLYDNSLTDHKLLRLMEADGLEEIEQNGNANAGDYYREGSSFGPGSKPDSRRYDGTDSGVVVDSFSAPGVSITVRAAAGKAGGGAGRTITVYNDGGTPLNIREISCSSPWLSVTPAAPRSIPARSSLSLTPGIDWSKVPAGGAAATVKIVTDDPANPAMAVTVRALRAP